MNVYFTLLFLFWHSKHFPTESIRIDLKKIKNQWMQHKHLWKMLKDWIFFHWSYEGFSPKLFLLTPSDKPKWTKEIAKLEARLASFHSILWQTSIFSHVLSIFTLNSMELGTFPCIISCNLYNSYVLFWH